MSNPFRVRHPERWWLAAKGDLPWLTDPDTDDGHQRWDDRDLIDWRAVATTVATMSTALIAGQYTVDNDDSTTALLCAPPAGLAEPEQAIVRSWWRCGPVADMWADGLTDGRHRLWNVWRAVPAARVAIRSDTLDGLDDVPYMPAAFANLISQSVSAELSKIPAKLRRRNPPHMAELERVALLRA